MTEKKTSKAKMETKVDQPTLSIDDILADLKGFGVEDLTEPINVVASGKTTRLKLSNVPNDSELNALLACEEYKGHVWVTRVKVELLSRSISWINDISLRDDSKMFVTDPTTGKEMHIRPALRNLLMGWGQEVVNLLWKILMVHCQKIEDRLFESMPDSQIMTDVEKRFLSQAIQEMDELNREVLKDSIRNVIDKEE